jgi:hypothetical protein
MQEKKKRNYYAIKILALVIFGAGGFYALLYLIGHALAQKSIFGGILFGCAAILVAPLVNTVTGVFDDSVEATPSSFFGNYWKVLVSLVFQLLFIVCIFPFIAVYAVGVLGAVGLVVCVVYYFIYLAQNIIGWDIGAAKDIGEQLGTINLIFLGLVVYETLFWTGYYLCNKYDKKIWTAIRKVFNR